MGRPLRKLHQTHFCISIQHGYCNIRTTSRRRIHPLPERVEAPGFVSKNDRLEKADRKPPVKDAGGGIGNMIQYPTNCGE